METDTFTLQTPLFFFFFSCFFFNSVSHWLPLALHALLPFLRRSTSFLFLARDSIFRLRLAAVSRWQQIAPRYHAAVLFLWANIFGIINVIWSICQVCVSAPLGGTPCSGREWIPAPPLRTQCHRVSAGGTAGGSQRNLVVLGSLQVCLRVCRRVEECGALRPSD